MTENYIRTDFHIHLEGAVSWDFLKKHSLKPLEEHPEWLASDFIFASLSDFVSCFRTFMDVFSTRENFLLAAEFVGNQLIHNRVEYAEIVFGPKLSSLPREQAIQTLKELKELSEKFQKKNLTIKWFGAMTAPMEISINHNFYNILTSVDCISGIDLAGVEELMDITPYIDIFQDAENRGFKRKAHAGETTGPEEIRKRIELLNLQQIGHGISLQEDRDLMSIVKEKNILVELCPVSNYKLSRVTKLKDHPLKTYLENDIPVTLCTDDPLFFHWHEHMDSEIEKHIGLSRKQIAEIYQNSLKYKI